MIYSVGLTLVGLQYGATVGIIAGVLSFIPYVGSGFGLVCSMILALIQFSDPTKIAMVLGVFVVGQILEGYVLTPKLVGGSCWAASGLDFIRLVCRWCVDGVCRRFDCGAGGGRDWRSCANWCCAI